MTTIAVKSAWTTVWTWLLSHLWPWSVMRRARRTITVLQHQLVFANQTFADYKLGAERFFTLCRQELPHDTFFALWKHLHEEFEAEYARQGMALHPVGDPAACAAYVSPSIDFDPKDWELARPKPALSPLELDPFACTDWERMHAAWDGNTASPVRTYPTDRDRQGMTAQSAQAPLSPCDTAFGKGLRKEPPVEAGKVDNHVNCTDSASSILRGGSVLPGEVLDIHPTGKESV
jgi:hypothetical protein